MLTRGHHCHCGTETLPGQHSVWDVCSSEGSGDEELHDAEQEEMAVEKVTGAWQLHKETSWMRLAAVYFRHKTSRCIHVLQDESGSDFLCGRRISAHYIRLERKPEFLHPVCTMCERAVGRSAA